MAKTAQENQCLSEQVTRLKNELDDCKSQLVVDSMNLESTYEVEKRKAYEEIATLQRLVHGKQSLIGNRSFLLYKYSCNLFLVTPQKLENLLLLYQRKISGGLMLSKVNMIAYIGKDSHCNVVQIFTGNLVRLDTVMHYTKSKPWTHIYPMDGRKKRIV